MRKWIMISLAVLFLAATGCSTAAKQAYYGVKGAKGEFYELKVLDQDVMVTYKAIRFEPFTNELFYRMRRGQNFCRHRCHQQSR